MLTDQAEGLRKRRLSRLSTPEPSPVRVIAVASGKGGVGKTSTSINLSVAMAKLGSRVVILDADMGLANVDVMLGLNSNKNLADLVSGRTSIRDILLEGPEGIKIIPSSSGIQRMAETNSQENAGIIHALSEIEDEMDCLVIDTAAGITDAVTSFCRASQDVVVVLTDEPSSFTDAYALIKVLSKKYRVTNFNVLCNSVKDKQQGKALFEKFHSVIERFLGISVRHLGTIPYDPLLKVAIQKQKSLVAAKESAPASRGYLEVANKILKEPVPCSVTGHVQFFVESLLKG
jgi:flagellar biosynthesis protein FlhG